MGEQREQSGSAAGAAAFHRADGHVEDGCRLRHGIALHVHEDEGGALVGREGAQGRHQFAVQVVALGRSGGGLVGFEELFQPFGVVDGEVLLEAALRARSRQAFTVMRCSQVVTADWPRKV